MSALQWHNIQSEEYGCRSALHCMLHAFTLTFFLLVSCVTTHEIKVGVWEHSKIMHSHDMRVTIDCIL